jgi:hypothetical protein
MKMTRRLVLAVLWVVSSVGVGLWAQGLAQDGAIQTLQGTIKFGEPFGPVLTGENIGLQQVAGPPDRDGKVPVRLLVKVNGEWRETTSVMRIVR